MPRSVACAFLVAAGCGYAPVYGGTPAERLHVDRPRILVPDAVAAGEVASGLREELAREGALEAGDGWPRVEIEVLRADESSEGIAARAGEPAARATRVALVGRAWIERSPGAPPERDTGDMRADEVFAVDRTAGALDPRASSFHYADALRAAARRLGRGLASRLTGGPASVDVEVDVGAAP